MILGFAHLAINTANLTQAETEWSSKGYDRAAMHGGVDNHPSKRVFLRVYQPKHELLLLTGRGLWPLELTYHGPTHGKNTQLVWSMAAVGIRVPELQSTRQLLIDGLGFSLAENGRLRLVSRLPGWSCCLELEKRNSDPVRLDASGPTCLAFYSNRIKEDVRRLSDLGAADCTDIFELTLGERNMSIAMMRLPGGPLLELISPRTRSI